jgi:hypothetical protein
MHHGHDDDFSCARIEMVTGDTAHLGDGGLIQQHPES